MKDDNTRTVVTQGYQRLDSILMVTRKGCKAVVHNTTQVIGVGGIALVPGVRSPLVFTLPCKVILII